MNKPFVFDQSTPRRLQTVTTRSGFSKQVASTGSSSIEAVAEHLKVFGNENWISAATRHNHAVLCRYWLELRQLHWENTGEWLPIDPPALPGSRSRGPREYKPKAIKVGQEELSL